VAVSSVVAIRGIVYALLLLWLLYQLARRPKNIPLRALLGLTACWVAAYPFEVASYAGSTVLFDDKLTEDFIENSIYMAGSFCLICFFLFTLYDLPGARRRLWIPTVPLVVAVAALAVLTMVTPADQRDAVAQLVAGDVTGKPHTSPPIGGWFNFIPNTYQLFTFACSLAVTWQYIREGTDKLLRQGMILAAVGLAALTFGTATFIIANLSKTTTVVTISGPILIAGIVAVFAGMIDLENAIPWGFAAALR